MRPKPCEFSEREYDKASFAEGFIEGYYKTGMEVLRRNTKEHPAGLEKYARICMFPVALARELIKPKTDDDAYERWIITKCKRALDSINKGIDVVEVQAETKLSMCALGMLKTLGHVPMGGSEYYDLMEFAHIEDFDNRKY
ncbi:MAG: hypothetical protein LBT59_28315 [Clostridiales bacterium]|nr:hypothetical protein [Clostridiales bacterium]